MAKGNLTLPLATVSGGTLDDRVELRFTPLPNSSGGFPMRVQEFRFLGASAVRVTGIQCADIGTLYAIEIRSRRYQVDAFQMRIAPGEQTAEERRLMVDPMKVVAIDAPPYERLDPRLRAVLEESDLEAFRHPDDATRPLQGQLLYQSLQPLQLACLLNLVCKANHTSSASIWNKVKGLRQVQQDRVFALVDDDCFAFVSGNAEVYQQVSGLLHDPMPGFERRHSFKTRNDRTAGLQVSFMQHATGGHWAADIDIDEAAGIQHKFEVIRNAFRGLTNPYQVRELLVLNGGGLNPEYTFIFDS